ncbi:unnamed protein product [Clavelina lepadiformis]|uniref:Protein-PII uridylyltransferase N-terminal domain-containing protein n=1 Tax=Clavelina lepadiformis TaxID=159417 RepID=A0ABP0FDD9_CLALP
MADKTDYYLWNKELNLAKDLRKCCDEKGKENDINESAKILHQLGLVYKERSEEYEWKFTFAMAVLTLIGNSPSRITALIRNALPAILTSIRFALIRSAALMNAAIVRKPSNVDEIKNDLDKVHRYVLKLAKVQRDQFDVDAFVDEVVREKIKSIREETELTLDKLKHIPDDVSSERAHELEMDKINRVKTLQDNIAAKYTNIMKSVSDKCTEIMGKPPCRYCVAGMGSLARKEITPYSDFEHVILLDDESLQNQDENSDQYQSALEYFRWFSVLFHVIILRLGETIIPAVSVPSLNNNQIKEHNWFYDAHTPRGISFDGMVLHACKFPLGRQEKTKNKLWTTELIKPVTKMVEYLDADVDFKNGYHLADILTKTSFVSGFKSIYDKFLQQVTDQIQSLSMPRQHQSILKQLEEDLNNFDVGKLLLHFSPAMSFNIKHVVYRSSTLFIAALGRLNSVHQSPCSCYDVIDKLTEKQKINSETAHKLAYSISIACEVRLKIYCLKRKQDDMSQKPLYCNITDSFLPDLIAAVGKKSIVDYFKTTWSLQTMIRRNNYNLVKTDTDTNIIILYRMGMFEKVVEKWNDNKNASIACKMFVVDALKFISRHEDAISLGKSLLIQPLPVNVKILVLFYITNSLVALGRRGDGVCKKLKNIFDSLSPNDLNDVDGWFVQQAYGRYLLFVDKDHEKALGEFIKLHGSLLKSRQTMDGDDTEKEFHSKSFLSRNLLHIAFCLHFNGNNKQAIKKLKEAFKIFNQLASVEIGLVQEGNLLLGVCYYAEKLYRKALMVFDRTLLLYKRYPYQRMEQRLPKVNMAVECCKAMLNEKDALLLFSTDAGYRQFAADLCHIRIFIRFAQFNNGLENVFKIRKDDYKVLLNNLMEEYEKLGCRMSLKMHYLHYHLDFFSANMGV